MYDIKIADKKIGTNEAVFFVAEMSGNHNGDLSRALEIVDAAAEAGVDAIKLQTYTADTITLDCDNVYFKTQSGGLWEGRTLYDLYSEAYTPWEWHEEIFTRAKKRGLICFSAPFDFTAVDFLEKLGNPIYKIASYEIQDLPLIEKAASTGKPIMLSTGIAKTHEIAAAVETCHKVKNNNIILLKCTSAYPTPYEDMNLNVIPDMKTRFDCLCGISDHSLGDEVAVASVALGARVIEKHMTLRRDDGGVDSAFSMEPEEFADMIRRIRNVEKAIGKATYELTKKQIEGRAFGRSLFVTKNIAKGELFTEHNIRSIRPATGLPPKYYYEILGKKAKCNLQQGTPLSFDNIE